MNSYTPGARVSILDIVSDPFTRATPGQPADPDGFLLVDDASESVAIWRPNGTIFSPSLTVTHVSLGTYRFTFVLPTPPPYYPDSSIYGVWSYQTSSTGAAYGNSEVEAFLVEPVPS